MPSICCVKSRSRFVVSSEPLFGVRRLRGVGEGDLEDDRRLREVEGASRPGVRVISPRLVGVWPSFAKMVISGISEKVLKHVSSTLVVSGPCIVDARRSRPAWNNEGVLAGVGSARSKDLPRVAVRGVVCVDCRGVFLGVLLGVLRAEGVGGGMLSESALAGLLGSVHFSTIAGDLIDLTDPGVVIFLGERSSLVTVACSWGAFSLSSMTSVKSMIEASSARYAFCGVATCSSIGPSAMLPSDGLCCLLGLLVLASISLWKGDEGGPSTLNMLSSTGGLACIDGDSIVWCVVCGGGGVCSKARARASNCSPGLWMFHVWIRRCPLATPCFVTRPACVGSGLGLNMGPCPRHYRVINREHDRPLRCNMRRSPNR